MSVRVSASPRVVRVWAEERHLILPGQRGRLGASIISAYNAANGSKHTEKAYVKTVKHTAKPAKGRSVTRTIVYSEVRAAAAAAGVFAGVKGIIPTAVLDAYVLGTL